MKSYGELLSDPRWKAVANEVKQRDGYKCVECGSTENIDAHHTEYHSKIPWETPIEYIKTLCHDCHKMAHYYEKKIIAEKQFKNFTAICLKNGIKLPYPKNMRNE
jgi:5-methylcytosine-specific restriction endonuclease McrA